MILIEPQVIYSPKYVHQSTLYKVVSHNKYNTRPKVQIDGSKSFTQK